MQRVARRDHRRHRLGWHRQPGRPGIEQGGLGLLQSASACRAWRAATAAPASCSRRSTSGRATAGGVAAATVAGVLAAGAAAGASRQGRITGFSAPGRCMLAPVACMPGMVPAMPGTSCSVPSPSLSSARAGTVPIQPAASRARVNVAVVRVERMAASSGWRPTGAVREA